MVLRYRKFYFPIQSWKLKSACFPFPVITAGRFYVSKHCGSVQRHSTAAHLLALNKRKFHRLKSEYRKLPLQQKNSGSYKTVLQEKVPGKISISATNCPSFCAFSFAAGGTIILETEDYSTKALVGPFGRI